MSTEYTRILQLAEDDARRSRRTVAVIETFNGEYDLVYADDFPDDEAIVWVHPNGKFERTRPTELAFTSEGTLMDNLVDEIRNLFGENGFRSLMVH